MDNKVLVIKRIHVTYDGIEVPEERRDAVARVLAVHAEGCPVARSLRGATDISTSLAGFSE